MGWLLFRNSNLAECQTQSLSAWQWMLRCFYWRGSVGVCLLLLLFNYKGRHLKPSDWWRWKQKCLPFFLPQNLLQCLLLLATVQSSSQLKWTRVVVYLVLPGSFWAAARFVILCYCHLSITEYAQTICRHQMTAFSHFIFDGSSLRSGEQIFFFNPKIRVYKYDRHTLLAATGKRLFN